MLARSAPPSVDFSASAERGLQSRSCEVGGLLRPAPALHDPLSRVVGSLVKGIIMPVRGLVGRIPSLSSCSLAPRPIHSLVNAGALASTLHAPPLPAYDLGGPGLGLQTATGPVGFARSLSVTVCGLDECAHTLLAVTGHGVTVCGHTGFATGHRIGPFSPLTIRGHGIEAGSLGGVAGIERKLLRPPGIAATLGRGRSLRWRAALSPGPHLLCRTSPGCSSACWGPMLSAMRLWALRFRLLASPVCCLVLLLRSRQKPPLHVRLQVFPLQVWVLPLRPVDMSVLGSDPPLSGATGARLAGRGPSR